MVRIEPIRVLHIRTVRGTGGGPDKTTLHGCRFLNAGGHRAEAFYILDRGEDTGRLQALAAELGVTMHVALESGPVSMATVNHLHRVLRDGRYGVVHTHEYKSNALAQLLRPSHRYRVVATAHGYNRTTRREWLYYGLERAIFRHVHAIIAPTRDMFRLLRRLGIPPSRLHVIPNGIHVAERAAPPRTPASGCTRLLYLGRLSAEKDPANLLRAVSELAKGGLPVQLTMAGDGPHRPAVERLIADLGLQPVVRLAGFVADVMPLLAASDILVNPSRTECMPNSVLEAMWAGVPVVATDVGGVSEMIRDEVDGLLCRPCDPSALARKVARLAADKKLGGRLAASAHLRILAEFSFERRMERVTDLYHQVLSA